MNDLTLNRGVASADHERRIVPPTPSPCTQGLSSNSQVALPHGEAPALRTRLEQLPNAHASALGEHAEKSAIASDLLQAGILYLGELVEGNIG